jgi:hypothetical protein
MRDNPSRQMRPCDSLLNYRRICERGAALYRGKDAAAVLECCTVVTEVVRLEVFRGFLVGPYGDSYRKVPLPLYSVAADPARS